MIRHLWLMAVSVGFGLAVLAPFALPYLLAK